MKLIGEGFFTKCFDAGEGSVELHTFCNIKPAYAEWGVGSGRLFPSMTKIDVRYDHQDIAVTILKCKRYPKVASLKTALAPAQYALYLALRAIAAEAIGWGSSRQFAGKVRTAKNVHWRHREDIATAVDDVHNYASNVGIDISPRNVAVDNGRLVLLDVFFDADQALAIWTGKTSKPCFSTAR